MLTSEIIWQTILSGLLMGCIYALVAIGLCVIWGLMEIVNFAHGEFLMLAMFTAFWGFALFHMDPLLSLPFCMIILFLIGVATYYIIIKKIIKAPFPGPDPFHLRPGDFPALPGPVHVLP